MSDQYTEGSGTAQKHSIGGIVVHPGIAVGLHRRRHDPDLSCRFQPGYNRHQRHRRHPDTAISEDTDSSSETADTCNDLDSDALCAANDNCVAVANPDQVDADSDNTGDACDPCSDVSDAAQAPYLGVMSQIPGVIELENFDEGGSCVAWSDIDTENRADTVPYRPDEGVDAHGKQVEEAGDYVVGYTYADEWVEYTVTASAGRYDIALRYSSEFAATDTEGVAELLLDEAPLGIFHFANTTSFAIFTDATVSDVPIPATSTGVLRLVFKTRYANYTHLTFTTREE